MRIREPKAAFLAPRMHFRERRHAMDVSRDRLCYLEASKVMGPTGHLDTLDVRTREDEFFGSVDGVLIDPLARRLRFFVLDTGNWRTHRRCLLPADATATVDRHGNHLRLQMEADELGALEEFDTARVDFTADDATARTLPG
jgi:hypothetical protein